MVSGDNMQRIAEGKTENLKQMPQGQVPSVEAS